MLSTARSGAQIALSPQEIEQWPGKALARVLAGNWPAGRPASFRVPALERAVPVCRQLARLWMDSENITDESARWAVLLVISELMTNAIVHTNSVSVTGHLRKAGDRLLVEVRDGGGAWSVPHRVGHTGEYGRGLALIARSVQELGTRRGGDGGRTFWAQILLSG